MTDLERTLEEERRIINAATAGGWEESWRQVPGFEGYEVSDFGNVRSYLARGNHKAKRADYPRTLKTPLNRKGGYRSVQLRNAAGKFEHHYVHRLVLMAFEGPCPEGLEVAHLNGDNQDSRLENLAYVTHQENESHKRQHGTASTGEGNSNAKLQGWQVAEIKYLAAKSVPQAKIAQLFDVSHKHVGDILRGKTWGDVPAREDARTALPLRNAQLAKVLHECGEMEWWAQNCFDVGKDAEGKQWIRAAKAVRRAIEDAGA